MLNFCLKSIKFFVFFHTIFNDLFETTSLQLRARDKILKSLVAVSLQSDNAVYDITRQQSEYTALSDYVTIPFTSLFRKTKNQFGTSEVQFGINETQFIK